MKTFPILKKYFALFFLAATFVTAQPLNVMTFNIRLDVESDGANGWKYRKEMVIDLIRYHHADLIGLQEVLPNQLDDLIIALPEFGWFGVGRDDGKRNGEIMAIFFLKEKFDTLGTGTFWCSPTPEKPGLGWDAACNRTITWGVMREKNTGKKFHHFNTHLDHVGVQARRESAKLLREKIDALTGADPVVVTGDFNTTPDSEPYRIMTGTTGAKRLSDSYVLSQSKHYGPIGTFTGFDLNAKPEFPIDFIFVSDRITVLKHATLSESMNGRFPSDHFPVLTSIRFNGK